MKKRNQHFPAETIQRHKHGEQLKRICSLKPEFLTEHDTAEYFNELERYQVELKVQNVKLIQAEKNMEAAIINFIDLYDQSAAGKFTLDREGVICDLNPNGAKLLCMEHHNIINSNFRIFINNETLPFFNDFSRKVCECANSIERCIVTLNIKKNPCSYLHIEGKFSENENKCMISAIDITGLKDAGNNIYELNDGLRKLLSDRTKRLESEIAAHISTEQAWQKSENRFRAAQEVSLEAFVILRSIRDENKNIIDFEFLYSNPAAGKILNIQPEKLIGEHLNILLPQDRDNPDLFERFVRIVESGIGNEVEIRYQQRGMNGWFRNMAVKLDDGVAVSFSDITERKKVEMNLLHDKEKLELLVAEQTASIHLTNDILRREITEHKLAELSRKEEYNFRTACENSMHAGISVVGMDGKLTYVNPFLSKMTGWTPEELIGQSQPFSYWPIDERENIANSIDMTSLCKIPESGFEFKFIRKNGEDFDVHLNTSPLINANGEKIGCIAVINDITETKLAQKKINSLLQEKDIILHEVHHRIKNNMNTIMGLLTIQADAQDNQEIKDILDGAAGRLQSMSVLYEQLYCSTDETVLSIKEYLTALILEIIRVFSGIQSVTLDLEIDDINLHTRMFSPIGIIINELITNAMKYAFTGRSDGILKVTLRSKDKDHIILEFSDNGCGIPEGITIENSTGFGMKLIGMLIDQMNGSVDFSRDNGTMYKLVFEI